MTKKYVFRVSLYYTYDTRGSSVDYNISADNDVEAREFAVSLDDVSWHGIRPERCSIAFCEIVRICNLDEVRDDKISG